MALSKKAKEILNRPDLIEKRDRWFDRIRDIHYARTDKWNREYVLAISGVIGGSTLDRYKEPERWVEDCLESLASGYEFLEQEYWFRPLSVEYEVYSDYFISNILGANVFRKHDQWYGERLNTPVGQLRHPDLESSEIWQLTKRALNAFLEADVALPLFSLPHMSSTMNTALNLYSGDILEAILLEPEAAAADLNVIAKLIRDLHIYFRDRVPESQLQMHCSPTRTQMPGCGELCGCSTQLLSGPLYAEMAAALDDDILSVYPNGGLIHLCGSHTQHIETFRNMKSLTSVQLNDRASEDLEKYFYGLRDDQIIYFMPCEKMTLEQALEITGGERIIILPENYDWKHPLINTPIRK